MSFLSPLFLLGLPLLSVPVIIHLLSRRQQKRISWGAMRFLMQAATRKRRIWRLTDLLLLLLRVAALLLFILALARPLLPATWLGGAVPREVILVLDPSMSMSRRSAGQTLFQKQIEEAVTVLEELNGNDTIRVLLAGEAPYWLSADPLPATGGTVRRLQTELETLQPTLAASDLAGSVREALDIEAPEDKSARVIYLISDGQRLGWRPEEKPLWAALRARLETASIPTAVNLHLLESERPGGNLSVNEVGAARPFGPVGQSLTFTATIQNHGAEASAATLISWFVEDESIGVSTVPELAAGASTMVTVNHAFEAPGTFDVSCAVESTDPISADNEGHLLVEIYERLPVLVVEDGGEPEERDTPFILAALGAGPGSGGDAGAWRSVFEPTTIAGGELATRDLGGFRCVLVAGARGMSPDAVAKLETYARNGGGVWLALGGATDETFFNENFYRGGLGLAPLKLAGAVGDPTDKETFVPIRASTDAHPATAVLSDFQRLDLDRVRIYRRRQFDPFSGRDVSVLLQAPGGEAVAVERTFGRGRVLVQGIPLGVTWSTLPLCQVYVALLHEWLWYLSEPNLPRRNLAVGETLLETAPSEGSEGQLVLPDGRVVELAGSRSTGIDQFRYPGTRLPGPYQLKMKNASGAAVTARFRVRRNPAESDLDTLTDADREGFAAMKQVRLNGGLDAVAAAGAIRIPKHPLEGWLLTILAGVFLGELLLAAWTTHQRNLRVKPVTL